MSLTHREFAFDTSDFERIKLTLYKVAGIKLANSKDSMVYSRLARRLRALGLNNFSDYIYHLERNSNELEHFINGMTTNLTSFFREAHHFEMLKQQLMQTNGTSRIWCAASSTGEEVYSIAMSAAEAFKSLAPPVEIIATDIDSSVLHIAKEGIYAKNAVSALEPIKLKQFFHKGRGFNEGKVRVVPELQKLVRFEKLNLTDNNWGRVKGPFDVIFCRNVMIYFDKKTQSRVLKRLVTFLKSDGLYFAGHSENFMGASHMLRPIGKTAYKKVCDSGNAKK
ncbi:CheR family methyltransferase [Alteromonas hispanica]|uniref:Chemotaxis protein methyltransferase n=1 Tax=Alteromonas hispanica TaxID=315421 RepID=A0A6L9MU09_9ALTE|nr:CheR family methyltransferase [Alteromonas hispanica]NDW21739.1 chemotaxis protein CheR [Alteromonas hispanica]